MRNMKTSQSLVVKMDTFTQAYLECALWVGVTDDNGESLDQFDATDIAPPTLAEMVADCKAFQDSHYDDMSEDMRQAGHDFFLTRNRHGAGFWDGDWPDAIGKRLTDAAHVYGEYNLYLGDDSKIHSHGETDQYMRAEPSADPLTESIHILAPENFPLDKGSN